MPDELTRLGQELGDPAREREFRARRHAADVVAVRTIGLLYLALGTPFLAYSFATRAVAGPALIGHLVTAALVLGATYLAFSRGVLRSHIRADLAVATFGLALALHAATASVQAFTDRTLALLVFALVLLVSWVVVTCRMSLQIGVAAGGTAGLVILQALAPAELRAGTTALAFIVTGNVVGYVARRRLNAASRSHYLAQRRAEHRAERFKALSAEVPIAVLVLDRARAVMWANAHACTFYGRTLDDLLGTVVGQLLRGSSLIIGQALRVDLQPIDTLRACRVRATALPPGDDGWEILVVIQDVTADTLEYRQEARTDPLTHLLNRRGFEEQANRALGRARRLGQPVGLLFADLDHFKAVNDEHGHPVGDTALEVVADSLRQAIRPADPGGRYGGEEFVVLLPNARLDETERVAERLRSAVASNPLTLVDGRSVPLTISVGVTLVDTNETLSDAIDRADKAMLLAKRAGRDQVVSLTTPAS